MSRTTRFEVTLIALNINLGNLPSVDSKQILYYNLTIHTEA